jgi:flagellar motor switch protein FliN
MSDPVMANGPDFRPYIEIWSETAAKALGEIAGTPLPCKALFEAPAELPAAGDGDLWILAAASGAFRGEMGMRLAAASAIRLAQIFVGEPSAPAASLTPEYREAVVELLRQVSGLVVTAIKAQWGEVQLHLEISAVAPSWPASSTAWLAVGEEPASQAYIELQLSAALVAALRTEKKEPVNQDSRTAAVSSHTANKSAEDSKNDRVNLDLLLDVELAVSLRFGSRRLLLREILDLSPGSVVELDRQVQEPVDLLLDGRVVARGEVVVMDGSYGLRVTEVAPPSA